MFVRTIDLTEKDKRKLSKMIGEIMVWCIEKRTTAYMAEQYDFDLTPGEIDANINEMLYTLRKHVGVWRYIKILFRK